MRKAVYFSMILCGLLLIGCRQFAVTGSGNVVEETREISSADTIKVCCGMELYLTQGEDPSLRIEAEDNLMEDIIAERTGSTLSIEFRDNFTVNYRPTEPVKVFVTMTDIQGVTMSGGGRLEAENIETQDLSVRLSGGSSGHIESAVAPQLTVTVFGGGSFESDSLEAESAIFELSGGSKAVVDALLADEVYFTVSGGGRIDGQRILAQSLNNSLSGGSKINLTQFTGDTIDTDISGGGRAEIAGDVDSQTIKLSGGSDYTGTDLKSRLAKISGNGDAVIWATESLIVDMSGGSEVEYIGNPEIDSALSGGSEITPLGGR